jgi:3-deoxy-manno-octulosonate cytidylyltransferase (CMP-KDO synthetase)
MFRVVVPARYGSTRLPGKALLPLLGKPMVQWVYECARRSSAHEVIIATDDTRIEQVARGFGATALLTSSAHSSGTDRVAEVARIERWEANEIVVNLQGDEPLMPEALIDQVAALLESHPSADIATLATPLDSAAAAQNPSVAKVVLDVHQRALYFSRAPIPWMREEARTATFDSGDRARARRHIGIYAYRVAALARLSALPPSALEQAEQLEQLRALENGFEIRVADAAVTPGTEVNVAADVAVVEALLSARASPSRAQPA